MLLCIDTPEPLTAALRRAVAPGLDLPAAKLGDPPFSKSMVPGAALVWIPVSACAPTTYPSLRFDVQLDSVCVRDARLRRVHGIPYA